MVSKVTRLSFPLPSPHYRHCCQSFLSGCWFSSLKTLPGVTILLAGWRGAFLKWLKDLVGGGGEVPEQTTGFWRKDFINRTSETPDSI